MAVTRGALAVMTARFAVASFTCIGAPARSISFRPCQVSAPSATRATVPGDGMQRADPPAPRVSTNAQQRCVARRTRSPGVRRIARRLLRQARLSLHALLRSHRAIVSHVRGELHSDFCRFCCKTCSHLLCTPRCRHNNSTQTTAFPLISYRRRLTPRITQ